MIKVEQESTNGPIELRLRWDAMAAIIGAAMAFLFQAGAGIWYASQFDARLHNLEQEQTASTSEFRGLETAREATSLELRGVSDKLDSIITKLEASEEIRRRVEDLEKVIIPLKEPKK